MRLRNKFLAACAALALACSAHAATIFDVNATLGNGDVFAGNTPNVFDYKFDLPNTESGDMADVFMTTMSNGNLTALVEWSPTGSVTVSDIYLKIGSSYLHWDTSGVDWSIYDGFTVSNTQIVNTGNQTLQQISHVQLNGSDTPTVPDGGTTAALLGLGLVGLSFLARRRSA